MAEANAYSTTAAPASNAKHIKPVESNVARDGRQGVTPLTAGKVVTNCAVGFGPPLTVTVGFDAKGDWVELADPESTMENNGDAAYKTPCVLLMKRRE
jgi:hypothetical protein